MSWRPSRAVLEALLYATLAFGSLAFGCVEPWSRAILQVLAFSLALLCLLSGRRVPEKAAAGALWVSAAGIAAIGALQILFAASPIGPRGPGPFTASSLATGRDFLLWAAYAALLWSVPRILRTHAAARRFCWFLVVLGSLVALVGIWQNHEGNRAIYGLRYVDPQSPAFGPYFNKNNAASLMTMSLLVACGILLSRFAHLVGGRSSEGTGAFLRAQALIAALVAVLAMGIAQCYSRAAVLSLALAPGIAGLLAAEFLRERRLRLALLLGLLLPAVALAAFYDFGPLLTEVGGGRLESSLDYRASMYAAGVRMLRDSPVLGAGLGALRIVYPAYQDKSVAGIIEHVHSDWLELSLEGGLACLLILFSAMAWSSAKGLSYWWSGKSREMRCLFAGSLAASAAFFVHGAVDFTFHIPGNAAVFLALMAWIGTFPAWADKEPLVPAARSGSGRGTAAAGILCLALAGLSAPPLVAAWHLQRSAGAPDSSKAAHLAGAIRWDPSPAHHYLLALHYIRLAHDDPAAEKVFRRLALKSVLAAARADPLNYAYLYTAGAVLWRLGRVEDGRALLEDSRRVTFQSFWPRRSPQYWEKLKTRLETLKDMNILPEQWKVPEVGGPVSR